jgi:hypothetical protein
VCEYAKECAEYEWRCDHTDGSKCNSFKDNRSPQATPEAGSECMNLLSCELRNVLPEKVVDQFAEYWCEPDRCKRDENLGEFIQRVAQYAIDHCK